MDTIQLKLQQLGLEMPISPISDIQPPIENAKRVNDLVYVSGHGPQKASGEMAFIGRVGKDVTLEEGYEAARLCTLNCLAAVKTLVGTLDKVEEIIRIRGFVSSASEFYDQPKVMHGASELLLQVFGQKGRHARTAIGVPVLPGNISVEVDMLVRVKD